MSQADLAGLPLTSGLAETLTALGGARLRRHWPGRERSPGFRPREWSLGAGQPGRPALGRGDQGELAGRLVDHLVAEHHRAGLLDLGGVPVRVQDQLGPVVALLVRREDLVDHVHLPGMQHPLAVVAQGRGAGRVLAQPFDVADGQVRAVDGGDPRLRAATRIRIRG